MRLPKASHLSRAAGEASTRTHTHTRAVAAGRTSTGVVLGFHLHLMSPLVCQAVAASCRHKHLRTTASPSSSLLNSLCIKPFPRSPDDRQP